jgi:hypothetical protein
LNRFSFRTFVATAVTAGLLLGATGITNTAIAADNVVADGDGAAPVSGNALNFGTNVCVGTSVERDVAIAIKRDGQGNVFANSTTATPNNVSVTRTGVTGAGLTATQPNPTSITMPTNWTSSSNGTMTSAVVSQVTYSPTATGAISGGKVDYSATGAKDGGESLTRNGFVMAAGSAVTCDTTPPVITPSVSGTLGNNGWYRSDVTVSWTVTDPQSSISSSSGCGNALLTADSSGTTYTCTATSTGGTATNSVTIKRDATSPVSVAVTPSRAYDAAPDWYNHPFTVSWTGNDALSGIAFCDSNTSFSGPDTSAGSLTGGCTDQAGNSSTTTFSFRYDSSAPDVIPTPDASANANGWYRVAPVVSWSSSDLNASCSSASTYAGPDSETASVSGTCTDQAGNVGTGSYTFKYDATAPSATVAADRTPDHNGWYNHAVTATWSGSDNLSGIASCTSPDTHSTGDTATGSFSGTCTDLAGNVSSAAELAFKYDATAPEATATADRSADQNGWYNHPLTVSWTGEDNLSGIDACTTAETYGGPDAANVNLPGHCMDSAGNVSLDDTYSFGYDATGPAITQVGLTAANADGWNNTNVTVTWSCDDALSGASSRTDLKTISAEGENQSATGTCTDLAGNSASATQAGINIDKTAPSLSPTVSPNTVLLNASASAEGNATDALSGVASSSCDVVNTSSVGSHFVSCTATDYAGNTATASADYSVVYKFEGFFQPVDKLPTKNTVKAGRAVPMKFSLGGDQGLGVIQNGWPKVYSSTCTGGSTDAVEETVTAGSSSLSYDAATGVYNYVWKTQSSWAGSCRLFELKLIDGTVQQVYFQLLK